MENSKEFNNSEENQNNNHIETITFDYNSHDSIQTKITYKYNGVTKNIVSDIIMRIEEESKNKYFDSEKVKQFENGLFNSFKSVYYYDRTTLSLETDETRKRKLLEIFQNKDVKNALFISDGKNIDSITNIDTKEISFKITNRTQIKRNNFDNFKNIFYSSKITTQELDILNSIRFSYISYSLAKEMINKISKQIAIRIIKNTPDIFGDKLELDDATTLSNSINNYYLNKHFGTDLEISLGSSVFYDSFFEEDIKNDLTISQGHLLVNELSNKKNLRSFENFKRLLESEICTDNIISNIPLKNDVERALKIRFDTLLINQGENYDVENLSEFYKDNGYGFLCIQDNKDELVNRNLYKLDVDKENIILSMKASMTDACDKLNKVIDLREITDLDHREKIFKSIYPHSKNFTILTKEIGDVSFLVGTMKNGNIYKIDNRYLGNENPETVYIVDIAEFGYFSETSIKSIIDINQDRISRKIITLPAYDEKNSYLRNAADLKISMLEKIIGQKEFLFKSNVSDKIESLYKFNELLADNIKEFNIFNIVKEYNIIKKSDEFYKFAKDNMGIFFTSNLPTIFSSFSVDKEKKVFNNGFYYNISSPMSIKDIEQTPPLLTYISKTPNGEVISKIAKKFNVDIDIEKPFSLTNLEQNKLNIGKKEIVTTSKRGAIDFAFPPKTFILEKSEKEELKDIIKTIIIKNPSMTESKANEELKALEKIIEESSYLMMKNEQTIIDTSKFAPKEILVLLDENTNDLAKLNIPIADFYSELKERKIYDINDYVELVRPNSLYLEKLSSGLSNMISSFRKEHQEYSNITKEQIDSLLDTKMIVLKDNTKISPSELLLTKGNTAYKNKLFKDIGNKLEILKYYQNYIELEDTNKIFAWLNKQNLPKESNANLERLLSEKFIGNEIFFIENHSDKLFSYIQKNIPEENNDLYNQFETKLFEIYHNKKLEDNIVIKTAKLYSLENSLNNVLEELKNINNDSLPKMELLQAKLKSVTKLKNLVDIFALDISGLRPHQYEEALNYSVLKNLDIKNTQMAFLEMRAGKTGIAIFTQLFLALTGNQKDDLTHNFFVQNSNMNDITNQIISFCPMLARDISFISDEKVSLFKKEKSIELPVSIAKQITPHIIQMIKPVIKFKGEKNNLKSDTVTLANTYTADMNQIYKQLQYHNYDDLMEIYKKSPFIDILKLAMKRKVDKDISTSIKQSFIYIQMLHEKKYLAADTKDYIYEKMSQFVDSYIASKDAYKKQNLSKKGIVLIPKNTLYSINVDSPITNIDIKKKDIERKVGNIKLQTPYELDAKIINETHLPNFYGNNNEKSKLSDILQYSIRMPKQLKDYTNQGIIFNVSNSLLDTEILLAKENIAKSYLYNNTNGLSDDFIVIMEAYISSNTTDTSLSVSPVYKIEGLDTQYTDTLKVNLSDVFTQEKLEQHLNNYPGINEKTKNDFIEKIINQNNMNSFAEYSNKKYFDDMVYNMYDTSLASTVATRINLISPLLAKKYKDLAYAFKFDIEICDDKIPLPIRRQKIENRFTFFLDMMELGHKALNLNDLTNPVKKDLVGLQIELGYSQSVPLFRVKREQSQDLLLETIVKRNEALNNKYIVDISPNKTIISFDEAHKGLKTKSTSLTIHDVISYLHKVAIHNNGSVSILSGTPTSGLAEETGKIMSTGLDPAMSALITKSIDAYCTTYEFRDPMDAIIITAMDTFPNGKVEKALIKTLIITQDMVGHGIIDRNKFNLTEDEIEDLKEELKTIIMNIPTLDATQKDELMSAKLRKSYLFGKFEEYKKIFKVDEQLDKIDNISNAKIKITDLKQLLLSKIHIFTKKVPGINNYSTLASILLKMGSKNSINITRASENRKYNIIDDNILRKLYDARDVKEPVAVDIRKFKDKTLALSGYFEAYRKVLKLTDIKDRVSEIFEAWTIDMFSEHNREKAFVYFGLKDKYAKEDINSLISRSGKTVKDSAADIFNTFYFGSENEKIELSENKVKQEKVNLVLDIIDRFNDFTYKYYEFQNEARVLYGNEIEQAKIEEREEKEILVSKDGFKFDASKFYYLTPDLGRINLFERIPSVEASQANVITLSNIGDVLLNNNPIVFKTAIKANNWKDFSNTGIDFTYSLTNPLETEIMEYLASDSHTLYKEHIDKGDNIRVMSARSATLVISLMDTLKALINREDKSKKAVVILNKNSSKEYNFSQIIKTFNTDLLAQSNIDLKLTKSSTFQNVLDEVNKNKNNQICVVGNYGALAEGFNMVCINAAFYVSSTPNGQLAIQSFARDTNADKEISNIYLCNNGLINKYSIENKIKPQYFINPENNAYSITKDIFNNSIKIEDDKELGKFESLTTFNYLKITPTIVMTANTSKTKVEAYTAVMTGNYPKELINYETTKLFSLSDFKLNKKTTRESDTEIIIEESINTEIIETNSLGKEI